MYVIVDLEYASETLKPYSIQVTASGNDEYPWTVSLTSANAVGEPVASMVGYHPVGVWPQNFSASIGFCKTSATLAVPYGWWGYQQKQMMGLFIGAWAGLPIEAVVVWIAVT